MIATTHDWAPLLARRVRVHDSGGAIAAILSQANATDIITLSGGAPFLASDRASYLTGTSLDVAGALGKYV